ncbi:MAG TPA: glycosyl hydrolase [Streptosporangiaceae bacterium]
MWVKILAAFATPILAAVLVMSVLTATHHTAVPDLALPSVPSAARFTASDGSAKPIPPGACLGNVPKHFAGLAVKKNITQNSQTFQTVTGNAPQIVEFYNPFLKPFAAHQALEVINAGEIPLIQLNPYHVSERRIAEGVYDRRLKAYAVAVRKFGCAVVLSFGHEMNGWWYPWGVKGHTTPADFIAAWRHVHDVFAKNGARNVIWSWDPSHQYSSPKPGKIATPASEWYPGSKYVDWIGLDGYLGYDTNGHPQTFSEIFSFQLNDIRHVAPHKLIYIAETGVAPGPAALAQIRALFHGIAAYRLAGLVWFDALGQADSHGTLKEYRLQLKTAEAKVYKKHLSEFLR